MADKSFINMKAGDKPRGANENSTFNGTVLTIGRPEVIAKLTDIRVAKTQTDDKNAFSTSNLTSIFNDTSQYNFNGTSISLKSFHQRIRIVYEKPEQSQAKFEATAHPSMVAFQQKMIADIGGPMKGAAASLNVQEIVGNASPFNVAGATFGGFKCIQDGAKPTANFVKRVRITQLQSGAADGSGDKTSSQTANLTKLFNKTNLSNTNLTKVVFTQGSCNAIIDELKTHTTAPSEKIQTEAKAVLPTGLTQKVLDQATTAIQDKDAGITVESKMTKEVQTEVKSKLKEIQNAATELNPSAVIPSPGIGRSGANVFANVIGKVKGIAAKFPPSIKNAMAGLPAGVVPPSLDEFGGPGPEIPNLIEGVDPLTGKLSLNTNTSKLVQKGSLTPEMSPSNITNLNISKSTFAGYNTPKTHKFEFVDTADELGTEFLLSSRMKTGDNNKVIAFVVGWTDKLWGPPEKVNASSIHEISKASDLKNLIEREGNVKKALSTINNTPKIYGIQAHYLILTDGRIQRGRPIDEVRNPDTSISFDLTGVQVTIVANTENPVNDEQLASLKKLLSKAYTTIAGVNVYGDYELEPSRLGPAIDMDSLRDVFGKVNSIENPEAGTNGPSRKELVFTKPAVIAEGSKTKSVEPFSFSKIQRDITNIDFATGEELPADAQADLNNGLKAFGDLKKGKLDIDKGIAQAINDPKNSAAKLQGDAIIGKLTGGVDENKMSVDTIAKKLNASNLSKMFKG